MDDKSTACVLFGFSEESKGYRLYNPKTRKMVISRDVVFEEEKSWNWEGDHDHLLAASELTWNDDDAVWEESDEENGNEEETEQLMQTVNETEEVAEETGEGEGQNEPPATVREKRSVRAPQYLSDYITGNDDNEEDEVNMVEINFYDPTTFEEAEKSLK